MSTLQEAVTGAVIGPEWFHLTPAEPTFGTVDLPAKTTQRLYLTVPPEFPYAGAFAGSITLAIAGRTETVSFDQTILSTSNWRRALGALLIAVGVAVSWLISVGLRARVLRLDSLVPATRLADELRGLANEAEIATAEGLPLTNTKQRLGDELAALSPQVLTARGLIPPRIPNPFKPWQDRTSEYQQLLSTSSATAGGLAVLIREGFEEVERLKGAANPKAISTAVRELDTLAPGIATAAQARTQIEPVLTTLRQAVTGAGGAVATIAAFRSPLTMQEVNVQLIRTSTAIWLIWALATWLVGVAALLATNYSFGVGLDYFKCFFWGLGVQIAGQQLQQLSPSAVAASLSISVPKG